MYKLVAPATIEDLKELMYIEEQMKQECIDNEEDIRNGMIDYNHLLKDYEFPYYCEENSNKGEILQGYLVIHTSISHCVNLNASISVITKILKIVSEEEISEYIYEHYRDNGLYEFNRIIPCNVYEESKTTINRAICSVYDKNMVLLNMFDMFAGMPENEVTDKFKLEGKHILSGFRINSIIYRQNTKHCYQVKSSWSDIFTNKELINFTMYFILEEPRQMFFELNMIGLLIQDEWSNIFNIMKEDKKIGLSIIRNKDLTQLFLIDFISLKKLLLHYYTDDAIGDLENFLLDRLKIMYEPGDDLDSYQIVKKSKDPDTGETNCLVYYGEFNNKPNQVKSFNVEDYENGYA